MGVLRALGPLLGFHVVRGSQLRDWGALTLAALLLLVRLTHAQNEQPPLTPAPDAAIPAEEVWAKLTSGGGRKKLSLVIAPFTTPAGTDAKLSAQVPDVRAVFEADLKYSLYFTFEEPESGRTFSFSTDPKKPDLKGWSTTGAQILVCGGLIARKAGSSIQVRLYDLEVQRLIASKAFILTGAWRWVAHQMADEIIKILTGEDGICQTRIAFSQAVGREVKELAWVDYDGAGLTQLTSSGGLKLYPDWSQSSSRLAYCSFGTSTLNIYSFDLTTRRATVLSDRKGLNTTPAWSPDGRTIAVSLSFEGQSEIYLMDGGGRNLRRLTFSPGIDISPCWSPNGRQLAFVSDRTGSPQVYIINADGTDLRRLTYEGSYNTSPAWSPRGDLIAFVQRQPGGTNQICVTGISGDTYMRLTGGRNNEDPCWSPDGLHIAFSSDRTGVFEVYTMDWTGANQTRVTRTGGAYSPTWSPRLTR
jgi:TolB protein